MQQNEGNNKKTEKYILNNMEIEVSVLKVALGGGAGKFLEFWLKNSREIQEKNNFFSILNKF